MTAEKKTNSRQKTGKYAKKRKMPLVLRLLSGLGILAAALACCLLTAKLLEPLLYSNGTPQTGSTAAQENMAIMDRFDMHMTNQISSALEGILSVKKVYWLRDEDLVAPKPDPACYGETDDPSSLQGVLDRAAELLDIDEFVFKTDVTLYPGSKIIYYLDETIFTITWKEVIGGKVYTQSEIKIAHPSQFRRFLAGGTYGSDKQMITSEMAASVNAVVASSGDFYKFRRHGVIVYEGVVRRVDGASVDTCCVDDQGNLIFIHKGEITTMEEAQQFVDEHHIRFSMAFGPILIENGQSCVPDRYIIGEINDSYARACLGQKGELHYMLGVISAEGGSTTDTLKGFAKVVETWGCQSVYTLDGGQTACIVTNNQVINRVVYGYQRQISDIFYFATAIPEGA